MRPGWEGPWSFDFSPCDKQPLRSLVLEQTEERGAGRPDL